MAKNRVKDSVTGGQLDAVTMSQKELDEMIEKAGADAVKEYRKGSHKHNNPPHIVTTQDISARERAVDEKRGNKKLPDEAPDDGDAKESADE